MNPKALIIIAALAILAFVLTYTLPKGMVVPSYTANTNIYQNTNTYQPTETKTPTTNTNTTTDTSNQPQPQAVAAARVYAAGTNNVSANTITVLKVTQYNWPDSCLGLAKQGELCAQVIIPGYEIQLLVNGEVKIYRTNEDGALIREQTNKSFFIREEADLPQVYTKLHRSCKVDSDCDPAVQCISYYGVGGPQGGTFHSCEIQCTNNAQCPADLTCGTISDGPGQVCL
ncbi:hypothetical protein HY413_00255 [Candidatus Kaiserbacteria bacterium]|nr:hypothetical protein [Candidatus Kaiserbacteria bacterium]